MALRWSNLFRGPVLPCRSERQSWQVTFSTIDHVSRSGRSTAAEVAMCACLLYFLWLSCIILHSDTDSNSDCHGQMLRNFLILPSGKPTGLLATNGQEHVSMTCTCALMTQILTCCQSSNHANPSMQAAMREREVH